MAIPTKRNTPTRGKFFKIYTTCVSNTRVEMCPTYMLHDKVVSAIQMPTIHQENQFSFSDIYNVSCILIK